MDQWYMLSSTGLHGGVVAWWRGGVVDVVGVVQCAVRRPHQYIAGIRAAIFGSEEQGGCGV